MVWSIGQFTVMSPEQGAVMQERRGNFANIYRREGGSLKFRVHAFNFLPTQAASAATGTTPTAGTASSTGK